MPSKATQADQHQQPQVEHRKPLQPGRLARRYVADMMTAEEIAEQSGWSSQYVRDRLRDFGIPLRRPGAHSHLKLTLDTERLESFLQQGLSVQQISVHTGHSTSGDARSAPPPTTASIPPQPSRTPSAALAAQLTAQLPNGPVA